MRKVLLLFVLLIYSITLIGPTTTYALSCAYGHTVEEAYNLYDGVVIGKVDKVSKSGIEHNRVWLTVTRSFKGVDENKLTIMENSTWGATMGPSEVGEEYVFFLKQNDDGWENPLCAPTVKLTDASEMLQFLEDKEIPINEVRSAAVNWFVIAFVYLVIIVLYGYFKIRSKKLE